MPLRPDPLTGLLPASLSSSLSVAFKYNPEKFILNLETFEKCEHPCRKPTSHERPYKKSKPSPKPGTITVLKPNGVGSDENGANLGGGGSARFLSFIF